MLALLFVRPRQPVAPPLPAPDVVWATDIDADGGAVPGARATGPLKGQKRPPCAPRREREVVGACWIPHAERPPCPGGTFEGDGLCLVPVLAAPPPPVGIAP